MYAYGYARVCVFVHLLPLFLTCEVKQTRLYGADPRGRRLFLVKVPQQFHQEHAKRVRDTDRESLLHERREYYNPAPAPVRSAGVVRPQSRRHILSMLVARLLLTPISLRLRWRLFRLHSVSNALFGGRMPMGI